MYNLRVYNFRAKFERWLGSVDEHAITTFVDQVSISHGKCKMYSDEERYKIGKYTSERGPAAAVRKFKSKFSKLNESTCWSIKKKYEEELDMAKHK